jgi:hypothetical protein
MIIEAFGFASVSAMVLFYALETRSPRYVLAFGLSCLSSAAYAAMIGSWPFAAVESLWSVVACVRWRRASTAAPGSTRRRSESPIPTEKTSEPTEKKSEGAAAPDSGARVLAYADSSVGCAWARPILASRGS